MFLVQGDDEREEKERTAGSPRGQKNTNKLKRLKRRQERATVRKYCM